MTVEIRAVNHRFSEIQVRVPKAWSMLEDPVRKLVAQYVRRGRVDVTIAMDGSSQTTSGVAIDWSVAEQFVALSRELCERFSLETPLTAKDVLQFPGVLQANDVQSVSGEEASEWILGQVKEAAEALLAMKEAEGSQLRKDLANRLQAVKAWAEEIRRLAPVAVEEYRLRLQQRLSEWAKQASFEWDQQRVAQEVVLFAEKCDISEEVTRLQSHCIQFAEQFEKEEAIGRKLDFLLQEMNREANTIASKANHLQIQQMAVEMKTELEKMREQVQNIE